MMAAPDQTGGVRCRSWRLRASTPRTRSMKAGASNSATSFAKVPARLNGGGVSAAIGNPGDKGVLDAHHMFEDTTNGPIRAERWGFPFRRGEVRPQCLDGVEGLFQRRSDRRQVRHGVSFWMLTQSRASR